MAFALRFLVVSCPGARPFCQTMNAARQLAFFLSPRGVGVGLTGALTIFSCTPETYEIQLSSSSATAGSSGSSASAEGSDSRTGSSDGASSTSSGSADSTAGTTGCETEGVPWSQADWSRRRELTIDTSIFSDPVTNFPVLLRVPAEDLGPTWVERQGADLRFRSAEETILNFDIDDANAEGLVFVWLSIPEIDPAAGPMTVWMYYDNPEAEAWTESAAVWAGHISVHHLGSDLQDSAGEHGGASAWPPEVCDGECDPRIGVARNFDPELLHEVVFDNHQDYDLGSNPYQPEMSFSISMWMRSSLFAEYPWGALIAKGENSWRIHVSDFVDPRQDERITFAFDCTLPSCQGVVDGLGNYNLVGASTEVNDNVNDNAWHHIAATMEIVDEPEPLPPAYLPDLVARVYIDGVEVIASPVLTEFLIPEDDQPVRLGHNVNTANRWGGVLDEVRIEPRRRLPEEIAADYATVVNEHIEVGEEEQRCP